MKTPIQELIDKLEIFLRTADKNYWLEKEKQVIMDAYTAGADEFGEHGMARKPEEYFEETFGENI